MMRSLFSYLLGLSFLGYGGGIAFKGGPSCSHRDANCDTLFQSDLDVNLNMLLKNSTNEIGYVAPSVHRHSDSTIRQFFCLPHQGQRFCNIMDLNGSFLLINKKENGNVDCVEDDSCYGKPSGCVLDIKCDTLFRFDLDVNLNLILNDFTKELGYVAHSVDRHWDSTNRQFSCLAHQGQRFCDIMGLDGSILLINKNETGIMGFIEDNFIRCFFNASELPKEFYPNNVVFVSEVMELEESQISNIMHTMVQNDQYDYVVITPMNCYVGYSAQKDDEYRSRHLGKIMKDRWDNKTNASGGKNSLSWIVGLMAGLAIMRAISDEQIAEERAADALRRGSVTTPFSEMRLDRPTSTGSTQPLLSSGGYPLAVRPQMEVDEEEESTEFESDGSSSSGSDSSSSSCSSPGSSSSYPPSSPGPLGCSSTYGSVESSVSPSSSSSGDFMSPDESSSSDSDAFETVSLIPRPTPIKRRCSSDDEETPVKKNQRN